MNANAIITELETKRAEGWTLPRLKELAVSLLHESNPRFHWTGIYELFPDNGPVRTSLRGLGQAVPAGGYLVYTNQPWHPQMEMIARVLTHPDGRPWVMRRRTQAEMDQLVSEAGFEKVSQRIDPYGIFTVSVARRRGETSARRQVR